MPLDPTSLIPEILRTAADPQSATVGGETATTQPLPDLIEADKYRRSVAAAGAVAPTGKRRSAFAFLRAGKAVPPGSA